MFIYWDGFEIDGSDTDFDIVLPENVQVWEFVACFLSLPIFSDAQKPSISCSQRGSRKERSLTPAELKEKLLAGNYPEMNITVLCRPMEQLPEEIREAIYAISERRVPHEAAYGKVENPCSTPIIQTYFGRGDMTVELRLPEPGAGRGVGEEDKITGYVFNVELLRSAHRENPCFQINVGPGFYYEYAMFIIDSLRDHFPGMGVCGGLDCRDGWTGGCTYANSLYYLERILLPVEHGVRHTLKRLTEYDIVRSWSYRHHDKGGWKYEYAQGFYLAGFPWWVKPPKDTSLSFSEYLELVDMAFELDDSPFSTTCETAIRIMLPTPEEYSQNPAASKELHASLPDSEDRNFTGYFSFTKIDGRPMVEFRVPYTMKKYLLTLLELAESGAIDFIKPLTWQRRHGNDG